MLFRITSVFRIFWLALTILAGISVACLLVIYAYEVLSWKRHPNNGTMVAECSTCHSPNNPHRYGKSSEEWKKTVVRMLTKQTLEYSRSEAEQISQLLIDLRSADGETLHTLRCNRCHSERKLNPYFRLGDGALELLLRQHIKQNNFAIQVWEGNLIIGNILKEKRNKPRSLSISGEQTQALFQKSCGVCHTVSFLYRDGCRYYQDSRQWRTLIERMRRKAPDFIEDRQVPLLAEHSEAICKTGNPAP